MTPAQPPPPNARSRARTLGLLAILLAVLVGTALYAWNWYRYGQRFVDTDNAYVQGNLVQLTAQTPGTVLSVQAAETDRVRAGQLLVTLDDADVRVALAQAEAELARTVRELQVAYAGDSSLLAQVRLRESELARARAELARVDGDLKRRRALAREGAVSEEELRHAEASVSTAQQSISVALAALNVARDNRVAAQMNLTGTTIDNHPQVLRAAAQVRAAELAMRRTRIVAPMDGFVARRTVQIGQRIAAGASLMTLVSLNDLWVDANFKESQLAGIRLGQPVTLVADLYGDAVGYRGKIVGLAVGTGSSFALLPAQNATGNWIKVIQRVPVRIALERDALAEYPLRVGLSMRVSVDTQSQSGPRLADVAQSPSVSRTEVFDSTEANAQADLMIARIIEQNRIRRAP